MPRILAIEQWASVHVPSIATSNARRPGRDCTGGHRHLPVRCNRPVLYIAGILLCGGRLTELLALALAPLVEINKLRSGEWRCLSNLQSLGPGVMRRGFLVATTVVSYWTNRRDIWRGTYPRAAMLILPAECTVRRTRMPIDERCRASRRAQRQQPASGLESACQSCPFRPDAGSPLSACRVEIDTDFCRLTEPQGREISVASITCFVSQPCAPIHLRASCSDPNLPKYLVVPLGHAILTRQRSPTFTNVKTVLAPPISSKYAHLKLD